MLLWAYKTISVVTEDDNNQLDCCGYMIKINKLLMLSGIALIVLILLVISIMSFVNNASYYDAPLKYPNATELNESIRILCKEGGGVWDENNFSCTYA